MYPRLSALTPNDVDALYGITAATPEATPVFVFLVGAPGVGKSSAHSLVLTTDNYATINLDTLLESLIPFRAGSAAAWWTAHAEGAPAARRFTGLPGYQSHRDNVGAFGWAAASAGPIDAIRRRWATQTDTTAAPSLVELTDVAIARAIQKSINIVYETTLSLTSTTSSRVPKVDDILSYIKKHAPQYRVIIALVHAPPEDISVRLEARQEYNMPYRSLPFWRRVPSSVDAVRAAAERNEAAFVALERRLRRRPQVEFLRIENRLNPMRLQQEAPPRTFDASAALNRLTAVYAPPQSARGSLSLSRTRKRTRSRGSLYVSPLSAMRRTPIH